MSSYKIFKGRKLKNKVTESITLTNKRNETNTFLIKKLFFKESPPCCESSLDNQIL
jgi:hypothetical protein